MEGQHQKSSWTARRTNWIEYFKGAYGFESRCFSYLFILERIGGKEADEKMEDKKNLNLKKLAEELERQAMVKEDRVVSSDNIYSFWDSKKNIIKMGLLDEGKKVKESDITDTAHHHISEKLGINMPYYRKMQAEKPDLLVTNINTWLEHEPEKKRLLRFLNGELRAMLSDRYKIIDHDVIWSQAQEALIKLARGTKLKLDFQRADLTDDHLYVKITSPDLVDEVFPKKEGKKSGDAINGGIIIKNSETGHGRFDAIPFLMILRCKNGLIGEEHFSRTHLGRQLEEGIIKWSDDTREKELEATMLQFRDVITQTFSPEVFAKIVESFNKEAGEQVDEPIIAVNQIVKKYQMPKESNETLLKYLMKEEANDTKWGLSMAVTAAAQDPMVAPKYEDQIRLERAGAEILQTPMKQIIRGF